MKPIAIIAASSIAMLAGSFALAQPQPVPPAGGDQKQERSESREQRREEWRERRAERAKARLDERLAKVRDELKLKPEQTALFDKVEELVKQRSAERGERWNQMRERREALRHADLMERLDAAATRQGERATRSKELADAVRPLWTTLSDEQKTVLRRWVREAMAEGRERFREMRAWRGGWHDDDRGDRWERGDRGGRRHWRDHDDRRDDRNYD
nr:Spy/CpxP family protein refolding chaperone [Methylobacterium sp. ZNC0032]